MRIKNTKKINKPIKKESYKKRIKKLEKQLDAAWSLCIRNRDVICQKCHGSGSISSHHAFGRRHRATRWDLMNGVGLCYPCHIHWAHRDPCGFSDWFKNYIGTDQYERLSEAHNQNIKHTEEDLIQILDGIKSLDVK